ncbi:MAG: hypothetical protein ACTHKP_13905 [Nitrososphaeraceae archaeon]
MKTLIDVDLSTWGEVKKYATIQKLSLNSAVNGLLATALDIIESTYRGDRRG